MEDVVVIPLWYVGWYLLAKLRVQNFFVSGIGKWACREVVIEAQ